jgi:hypothetical protein
MSDLSYGKRIYTIEFHRELLAKRENYKGDVAMTSSHSNSKSYKVIRGLKYALYFTSIVIFIRYIFVYSQHSEGTLLDGLLFLSWLMLVFFNAWWLCPRCKRFHAFYRLPEPMPKIPIMNFPFTPKCLYCGLKICDSGKEGSGFEAPEEEFTETSLKK